VVACYSNLPYIYLAFAIMLTSFYLSAIVLAFSTAQVAGHAAINPALGVKGTAVRNDVQRPKTGQECGNVGIAGAIDNSTPVTADASGAFTVDVENFNGYVDTALLMRRTIH
jgi:hypothetical protein